MLRQRFQPSAWFQGEHAGRLCMLSKPTNDAQVVVGSGGYGSWAVTELSEGGKKSVMFEARENLDVANGFPAEAQEVGGGIVGPRQIGDSGQLG
jgi:tRNA A37 threonylcarbamoyladenosine dehydratase